MAAWKELCSKGVVEEPLSLFLDVENPPSRFTMESKKLKGIRRDQLLSSGGPSREIITMPLFCSTQELLDRFDYFLSFCSEDIVLDISCFPKRFFFPFVRRALASPAKNIVVTYTSPESYYQGPLAEDHEPLSPLPLFGQRTFPDKKVEVAIIAVGFQPLGLRELLDPYLHQIRIRIFLPFPPGPPTLTRSWRFLIQLMTGISVGPDDIKRIEAYDVSDVFDHIRECTGKGKSPSVLAPFGPKSMSLAMCLYAISSQSVVYYTQPRVYHPRYSVGIKRIDAYCLRINGSDLYTL